MRFYEILEVYLEKFHSGPLPSADALRQYGEVLSSLPERIVGAWEGETKHRRRLEVERGKTMSQLALRGQLFAAALSTMFFGGSIYLVASGHGLEGMAVIVAEIATLAGVFLYTRRSAPPQETQAKSSSEES